MVVHIHPNNTVKHLCRKYKGLELPSVMEFTFLRKDRIKTFTKIERFPHILDRPCTKKKSGLYPSRCLASLNYMMNKIEKVYLAGGCYWGLELLLQEIPGVINTQVGFSGGHIKNVCYKEVTKGDTGHAETVMVQFDPTKLECVELLKEFFRIHNPTTLNQQGNDRGSQYRSVIFYTSDAQKEIAEMVINKINITKKWGAPIVTRVEPFGAFYPAEESHQNYLQKNPSGYTCHFKRELNFD